MMKILIVDDHAVIAAGLKQYLSFVGGFDLAGHALTGTAAIKMLANEAWDLLLLDIGLPDMSGLELLKLIKRDQPNLPVLILSGHAEDDYAMAALEAGAAGYLCKGSDPEEVFAAIRRACAGERYLSPMLADKLLSGSVCQSRKMLHDLLSPREFEVMMLLSKGMPITEIGERIHLSPKTVSTYRMRLLEKLGISSNSDITRYVLKNGLV